MAPLLSHIPQFHVSYAVILEDEGKLKIIQYPRIVIEVFSPGTEAKDRGIKYGNTRFAKQK